MMREKHVKSFLQIFFAYLVANVNCNPVIDHQAFRTTCQLEATVGNIPVSVHRSTRTGLHIILAKIKGPVVSGYFVLPTEAHDDDGLPHTLEHLVFLGSEKYPFNAALDQIANRCFASGTNAWTDVDHTAYTLKTGGRDGFLNIMPVFLDHLLYPLLNESAFTTEVYHVTKKGNDAGVVYSEMQARENLGGERTYRERMLSLFPEPSGYRYQTGGILSNIRNSVNLDKIKKYHSKFYRPENLFVTVVGDVDESQLLKAIRPVEDKIVSKGDRSNFEQPWRTPVPSLSVSVDRQIKYPSKSEKNGMVFMGWRGPSGIDSVLELQSMRILLNFLTYSSVSILPKTFVEITSPLATDVSCYVNELVESALMMDFSGVPANRTLEIKILLDKTLQKVVQNQSIFEMDKMRNVINNFILNEKNKLESYPHSSFASYFINFALHGRDCQDLDRQINKINWLNHLIEKPRDYWIDLLQKYLIDAPSVTIRGIPSPAELKRLQKEKKKRIDDRKKSLGPTGLKELGEKVAEATKQNDVPTPNNVLKSFAIPSVTDISFHNYTTYSNLVNYENITSSKIPLGNDTFIDLKALPIKAQVDDVNSYFVEFSAILSTVNVTEEERRYMPLLLGLILQSAIQRDNETITHDEVIRQLIADTLKATTYSFKYYGPNIGVYLKVEMDKYKEGVQWMHDILFNLRFSADRIKVKAKQQLTSMQLIKTRGASRLQLMFFNYIYGNASNTGGYVQQEAFLKKLLETLESKPEDVLDKFNIIYKNITKLDSITLHLATNITELAKRTDFLEPWKSFSVANPNSSSNYTLGVWFSANYIKPFNASSNTSGAISGMDALQSTYLRQAAVTISNYTHSDMAALMVATNFISQSQGPMYKVIRGKGLAYSVYLYFIPAEGLMNLYIMKASQPMEAYEEAVNLIQKYVNETTEWDTMLYESAKSSLIYKIISRESVTEDIAYQSLLSYYRKVPHTYNRDLIRKIGSVTIEDVKKAGIKYLTPLIDPKQSRLFVVCPTAKLQKYKTRLAELGRHLEEVKHSE